MSNPMLCFPNYIDSCALSGGSYLPALPLSNLQTRRLNQVSRTTDATNASTLVLGDLGVSRTLRAVAIMAHNLSLAARLRLSLGTSAGANNLYAGPWEAAWSLTFATGSPNWGPPLSDTYTHHPFIALLLLPENVGARHWMVEFDDTTNADGYVQLGRIFLGSGFQPADGAAYGWKYGWRDLSEVDEAADGTVYADQRRGKRYEQYALPFVTGDEASVLHEIDRMAGRTNEVLHLPDPSDYTLCQRRGFVGRLRELGALEHTYPNVHAKVIDIEELV